MARLFADENFPQPTVDALRLAGHDVLTALEAGRANQRIDDAALLEFAINDARAVMTLNRLHFVRLHSKRPEHHGIIVCSADTDFTALARRIEAAIASLPGSLHGQLVRVNRPG